MQFVLSRVESGVHMFADGSVLGCLYSSLPFGCASLLGRHWDDRAMTMDCAPAHVWHMYQHQDRDRHQDRLRSRDQDRGRYQ